MFVMLQLMFGDNQLVRNVSLDIFFHLGSNHIFIDNMNNDLGTFPWQHIIIFSFIEKLLIKVIMKKTCLECICWAMKSCFT